jgi:hypothetical protein
MEITSAKYQNNLNGEVISIITVVDGATMFVPTDSANTDYAEIMRQVEAGELTIADAE